MKQTFLALVVVLMTSIGVWQDDLSAQSVEQHRPYDLTFTSSYDYPNSFLDVWLQAIFTGPGGEELVVPAFFDGGRTWRVRFSATRPGQWRYATLCSDPTNSGLHAQQGTLQASPSRNPLIHGRLGIDAEHPRHFLWEDGARCFMFGYEADWIWALDPYDDRAPNVRVLLDEVVEHGFNMLTFNLYAHDTSWSPGNGSSWDFGPPAEFMFGGTNDNPDHRRLNLTFFRAFDAVMEALWERGLLAHLMIKVYNKFVNWPDFESLEDNLMWSYVVARYQAYPNVIWDTGKESYNVERNTNTGYSADRIRLIRALDAYGHLITVHDPDRAEVDDAGDFKSDQVHYDHYQNALWNYRTWSRPYLNVEYGYEEGVDDLPTYPVEQRWNEVLDFAWKLTMGGAYANYYYGNTAWDIVKRSPEPPGYDPHLVYSRFWNATRFWELDPAPEVVVSGTVLCRASSGREYVFYSPGDNSFRISIQGASADLEGFWLDTRTGDQVPLSRGYGNGEHSMTPPFSFAALYLADASGPVAEFAVSNDQPVSGETIVFDASDSFSFGDDLVAFEWDFDGDGLVDDEGLVVQHTFTNTGQFESWLRVVDASDRSDTETKDLVVREPSGGLVGVYCNDTELREPVFSRQDAMIDFDWGSGAPDPRLDDDQSFSVRWTGWYRAEETGIHEFCAVSNDGVRLWIRDALVIDNWTQHGDSEDCSGAISLNTGWHRIRLEYFQNGGSSRMTLSASGLGFDQDTVPSEDLRVALPPEISLAGLTPNPYPGGDDVSAWAIVNDRDGLADIQNVTSLWFGPGGQLLGSFALSRWSSNPGVFLHDFGTLDLPGATWTVFFRAVDSRGLSDVYGPYSWVTQ